MAEGRVRTQAIRPDEEADLPVDLPEEKSGKARAKEDNEEDAGSSHDTRSGLCIDMPCSVHAIWSEGLHCFHTVRRKPGYAATQQAMGHWRAWWTFSSGVDSWHAQVSMI